MHRAGDLELAVADGRRRDRCLVDVGEKGLLKGWRFLAKPDRAEQLTDVLRAMIGGRQVRAWS
jgi:hypothetical protein